MSSVAHGNHFKASKHLLNSDLITMATAQGYFEVEHLSECALDYLIQITKAGKDSVTKIAAMAVLLKFLKTADKDGPVWSNCLENGLLQGLEMALDVGLQNCPSRDIGDIQLIDVALGLLWQLSLLSEGKIQPMINEEFLGRLLGYLDINGEFYSYPDGMRDLLQTMCESELLTAVIDEKAMSLEMATLIKRHGDATLKELKELPERVYQCTLFDPDTGQSDAGTGLKEKGYSWTCLEEEHKETDNFTEIFVVKIMNGGFFWAHVGETAVRTVSSIQKSLNSPTMELTSFSAEVGDYVVVSGIISNVQCIIRGRILDVPKEMVMVFAIDYGFCLTLPSNSVFSIPDHVDISVYPPQASLCYIAGLHPPPIDTKVVHSAAAVLCNFCKKSRLAGGILMALGGLDALNDTLQICPDRSLSVQLVKLLNNIIFNNKLTDRVSSAKLIGSLLAICKSNLHADNPHDKEPARLLQVAISCMCNMLYRNDDVAKEFYQQQGLELVLRIITCTKRSSPSNNKALKLLRVYVGESIPTQRAPATYSSENHIKTTSADKYHQRPPATYSSENHIKTTSADKYHQRNGEPAAPSTGSAASNIDFHTVGLQLDVSRPELSTARDRSSVTARVDGSTVLLDEADVVHTEIGSGSDIQVMDAVEFYRRHLDQKYYILGSRVNFVDDVTHELRPNVEVGQISSAVLSQYVCGMANTGKGGVLYFGIEKENGVVRGMKLSRDDRDELRQGVDRMMSVKITPPLFHSQFCVSYVPVFGEGETLTPTSCLSPAGDRFVIELEVKPNKSVIHVIRETKECFYRLGTDNHSLRPQELRQIVILDEETKYMEDIQRLKQMVLQAQGKTNGVLPEL
ncbi:hypothetical protein ScPMuIL_010813 [Solemya velum]